MIIFFQTIFHSVSPMKSNNWCVKLLTTRCKIRNFSGELPKILKCWLRKCKKRVLNVIVVWALEVFNAKTIVFHVIYNHSYYAPFTLHIWQANLYQMILVWKKFGNLLLFISNFGNFLEMLKSCFLTQTSVLRRNHDLNLVSGTKNKIRR